MNYQKVIWLYSYTNTLINRMALKMINYHEPKFDLWRLDLGLPFDEYVHFIFAWMQDREELSAEFSESDHPIIIVGSLEELNDSFEVPEDAVCAFFEPKEIEFYEAHTRSDDNLSWREARQRRDQIRSILEDKFDEMIIVE